MPLDLEYCSHRWPPRRFHHYQIVGMEIEASYQQEVATFMI